MSFRQLESPERLRSDLASLWASPVEIVELPRRVRVTPPENHLHTFAVLPSTRRPRIVATDSRTALAATVRRFSHGTGLGARSARVGLATTIRLGALETLRPDRLAVLGTPGADGPEGDSILSRLTEIFGTRVSIGMSVGAVRANRKPVLEVLSPRGSTLGFAKLGVSPLARSLVRDEAENLRLLAGHEFRQLELPRVIHHGTWHGRELLVMTALPTSFRRRRASTALPAQAMAELAGWEGTTVSPLSESLWFGRVRITAAEIRHPNAERFRSLLKRLGDRHGDDPLRLGSWHGDWGPWNMAWAGDRVRLWDWERFARGVPYGLDALYYALPLTGTRADPARLRRSAAEALEPFSLDATEADLLLPLYVTALCARFLPDSLTEHGAQLASTVAALLDLLEGLLDSGARRTAAPKPREAEPRPEEVRR